MNLPHFGKSSDTYGIRNNVMTPLNWFTGIAEVALMSGIIGSDTSFVKISCLIIFSALAIFYGSVYVYFMRKLPDRLQTEEYNVRIKELTLFQEGSLSEDSKVEQVPESIIIEATPNQK